MGRNAVRGEMEVALGGDDGLLDKWSVGRGENGRGCGRCGAMWHWSVGENGVCVGGDGVWGKWGEMGSVGTRGYRECG